MTFTRENIPQIQAGNITEVVSQMNGSLLAIQRNFEKIQQMDEEDNTISHDLMLGGQ